MSVRLMVSQDIHLGCRSLWIHLESGLFSPRLTPALLCNSTNINMNLLFSIGRPNCIQSTFPGWEGGGEENVPKSNLDLDLGFIKRRKFDICHHTDGFIARNSYDIC